jgi:hypothetical protein
MGCFGLFSVIALFLFLTPRGGTNQEVCKCLTAAAVMDAKLFLLVTLANTAGQRNRIQQPWNL